MGCPPDCGPGDCGSGYVDGGCAPSGAGHGRREPDGGGGGYAD